MAKERAAPAARKLEYPFSDTCNEAICDIKTFLQNSPPQAYTRQNADRVTAATLLNNHDPSETLFKDREQCRIGRAVGIILFIREELERMQEELRQMLPWARPQARIAPQLSLIESALTAADSCLNQVQRRRPALAVKSFQSMRDALISLQSVSPADMESGPFARIQHATALASDLLHYAGK